MLVVFETELMGIEGVPKPESIVTKSATDSPASSATQEAAEEASEPAEAAETPAVDTEEDKEL